MGPSLRAPLLPLPPPCPPPHTHRPRGTCTRRPKGRLGPQSPEVQETGELSEDREGRTGANAPGAPGLQRPLQGRRRGRPPGRALSATLSPRHRSCS